MATTGKNATK